MEETNQEVTGTVPSLHWYAISMFRSTSLRPRVMPTHASLVSAG